MNLEVTDTKIIEKEVANMWKKVPELFPRIVRTDAITYFGTTHNAVFTQFPDRNREFNEKLLECDHLLIEGNRNSNRVSSGHSGDSYEGLAIRLFRKAKSRKEIALEDKIPFATLGEKYGVSRYLGAAYRVVNIYFRNLEDQRAVKIGENLIQYRHAGYKDSPIDVLKATISIFISMYPEYKQSDLETIENMYLNFFLNGLILNKETGMETAYEYFSKAFKVLQWHMARIRDYEFIVPQTQKLVSTLRGRKAIVIGGGHVDIIKHVLEGGTLSKPDSWEEVKRKLNPDLRKAVDFTDEAFKTRTI